MDIVKEGKVFCKMGKSTCLKLWCEYKLVLRGCRAPFSLEIWDKNSVGKILYLSDVKRIKFRGLFDQKTGLKIIFSDSTHLQMKFDKDEEVSEWMEAIQTRSLAVSRCDNVVEKEKFLVHMLPNSYCRFEGQLQLQVTHDTICIFDMTLHELCLALPVHSVRFYGSKEKVFHLSMDSSCETGESVFQFSVHSKEIAKLIYTNIASAVSRLLQECSHPPILCNSNLQTKESYVSKRPPPYPVLDQNRIVCADVGHFCDPSLNQSDSLSHLRTLNISIEEPTEVPHVYGLFQSMKKLFGTDSQHLPLNGALLYGPSKCGKTLLVKKVAVYLSAKFINIQSTKLLNMKKGEIQMLFDAAKGLTQSVILFKNLEHIVQDSTSRAIEILSAIENAFQNQFSQESVRLFGTLRDPSCVDLSILPFHWMTPKIYVPLPHLEIRQEMLQEELKNLLPSEYSKKYLEKAESCTAGFNFMELIDICTKIRELGFIDGREGNCLMNVNDMEQVEKVLEEKVQNHRCDESVVGSARFFASEQGSGLFFVNMVKNCVYPDVEHCFLRVTNNSVDLLDFDACHSIASWRFEIIRKSGWSLEQMTFFLEVGRRNPQGEGIFSFETCDAYRIENYLQTQLQHRLQAP